MFDGLSLFVPMTEIWWWDWNVLEGLAIDSDDNVFF